MKKNILIIGSLASSLSHFRGDFITALVKEGYNVFAAAPDIDKEVSKKLSSLGAKSISFKLQRTGINPLKDLKSIIDLKKIIKTNQIDLVFPYTIKPVVYGSIAANLSNVPTISLITGLGFTFSGASRKAKILQRITQKLYRYGLRKNRCVIFQNSDDLQLFRENKIIRQSLNTAIVNGSGVNLDKYPFRVNKTNKKNVKFVIVARLIKEKGIQLFMDTAIKIKKDYPLAEFHIIGRADNSPSAVKVKKLKELHNANIIFFHGPKNNIRDFLKDMDVFVLPTYYREGVPRSILEALSIGLPIITTNMPGCKETVIKKDNGFLITPNNLDSLINACQFFLENPSNIEHMGKSSYELAKNKFDVNIINQELIKIILAANLYSNKSSKQ